MILQNRFSIYVVIICVLSVICVRDVYSASYLSKAVINLLDDTAWIESGGAVNGFGEGIASYPTEEIEGVRILSKKEIRHARDVTEKKDLTVSYDDGMYSIYIPPFIFTKSVEITYVDDVKRDDVSPHYPLWSQERINGQAELIYAQRNDVSKSENMAYALKEMGFPQMTRHVRSNSFGSRIYWPSFSAQDVSGQYPYSTNSEYVSGMLLRAQAESINFNGYYRDTGDEASLTQHPEWVCENRYGDYYGRKGVNIEGHTGTNIGKSGMIFLDFTTPYREVVLEQLQELAERGVQGFYFDHIHMPANGCFGSALEAEFRSQTGLDPTHVTNLHAFYRFQAQKLAETFDYWETELEKDYPNTFFIISTALEAGLTLTIQGQKLIENADMVKMEIGHGIRDALRANVFTKNPTTLIPPSDHVLRVLSATYLRDISKGKLFHMWGGDFPNEKHVYGFLSTALSLGGVAGVAVPTQYVDSDFDPLNYAVPITRPGQTRYEDITQHMEYGQNISAVMKDKTPLHYAGVLFSERLRNAYERNYTQAWHNVIWPSVGAYESFLKEGVPVTVLSEGTMTEMLAKLSLVYIPTTKSELPPDIQTALISFEARGGIILERDLSRNWSSATGAESAGAYDSFQSLIAQYKEDAPFWVEKSSQSNDELLYPFFYKDRHNIEIDVDKPIITLQGADPQIITRGTAYDELGATATDDKDGDISAQIIIDSTQVNVQVEGVYDVIYSVHDAAENTAVTTRSVHIVEEINEVDDPFVQSESGIVSMEAEHAARELGSSLDQWEVFMEEGVSQGRIVRALGAGFYNGAVEVEYLRSPRLHFEIDMIQSGEYDVWLRAYATDGSSDSVHMSLDDVYQSPYWFYGSDYNRWKWRKHTVEMESGTIHRLTLWAREMDIRIDKVVVLPSGSPAPTEQGPGESRRRNFNDIDIIKPHITLVGDQQVEVIENSLYEEYGAVATDNRDGNITNSIVTKGVVDTNRVGVYYITYNVEDYSENKADEVVRIVSVVKKQETDIKIFYQDINGVISVDTADAFYTPASNGGQWIVFDQSDATNGSAMKSTGWHAAGEGPKIQWRVQASQDGVHDIWIRGRPNSDGDSVWLDWDNDKVNVYWYPSHYGSWTWQRLYGYTVNMTANTVYSLGLWGRENSMEVDGVVILPQGSPAPSSL